TVAVVLLAKVSTLPAAWAEKAPLTVELLTPTVATSGAAFVWVTVPVVVWPYDTTLPSAAAVTPLPAAPAPLEGRLSPGRVATAVWPTLLVCDSGEPAVMMPLSDTASPIAWASPCRTPPATLSPVSTRLADCDAPFSCENGTGP